MVPSQSTLLGNCNEPCVVRCLWASFRIVFLSIWGSWQVKLNHFTCTVTLSNFFNKFFICIILSSNFSCTHNTTVDRSFVSTINYFLCGSCHVYRMSKVPTLLNAFIIVWYTKCCLWSECRFCHLDCNSLMCPECDLMQTVCCFQTSFTLLFMAYWNH